MNRFIHWLITHPIGGKGARGPSPQYAVDEGRLRIDADRMKGALNSSNYEVPLGLSREEKRQKLLAVASRQK